MKKTRKMAVYGLSVATSAMLLAGCETVRSTSHTTRGAVIGTAAGAGLGALIGNKAGNTAVGAIAGAAVGGVAGGLIGKRMDKQAREIEQAVAGAEVVKADEGIIVKFDGGLLFGFNSSALTADARLRIGKLVEVLNREPDTDILVIGHTDNVGSLSANQKVSESRAASVKSFAVSQGLRASRVRTQGRNYAEPIAPNDTEDGRAKNRRVEVVIVAGEQMVKSVQTEAGKHWL